MIDDDTEYDCVTIPYSTFARVHLHKCLHDSRAVRHVCVSFLVYFG